MSRRKFQGWTTLVDWTDESQDDTVRSVAIDTATYWQTLAQERDLSIDFCYMNDAARDQNPLSSYGTTNLDKLKQVSQKYDALQLFQTQQNGGFKVTNA